MHIKFFTRKENNKFKKQNKEQKRKIQAEAQEAQ